MKPWQFLPPQFLERTKIIVPPDKLDSVLMSFCQNRPPTFRANTLKISVEKLKEELKRQNIIAEELTWLKNAFLLCNKSQKELTGTYLYKNGYIYLQNLSSMLPPIILDPKPHEKILDIAAAPGSKTTQIAAIMGNTGQIIANDKSRVRLYKLEANLKTQGVTNARISSMPGQIIWKKYPEYFDKTLVDVPCGLEGTFHCDDPKSYESWSPQKVKSLIQTQRYLLRGAVSATKPGGTIVYSTCTLAPEENEGIINWILKREKEALKVEKIELPIENTTPALLKWDKKDFDPQIKNTLRILPSDIMEGFFVAKLHKLRTTISPM